MALKGGEPPVVVIGELKLTFNLELVLQGIDRAAACDEVWLAARRSYRGKGRESDPRFRNLCQRLGFGLLGVSSNGEVEVLLTPDSPTPRKIPVADPVSSRSTDAGGAILSKAEDREPLS